MITQARSTMMSLRDWTFANNVFVDVKGRPREDRPETGRAAIFVWVRSENILIEKNRIVGCDRGITLGLEYMGGGASTHVTNAVVRNNAIVPGPDAGIELARVRNSYVYNNTIWRSDSSGRGIRSIVDFTNVEIFNNLVRGVVTNPSGIFVHHNLSENLVHSGLFESVSGLDFRLSSEGASVAKDQGIVHETEPVYDDIGPRQYTHQCSRSRCI